MKFGPYNLDLSPRLVLLNLSLEFQDKVNHFWGPNGSGKSTVLRLIQDDMINSSQSFGYLDQNYRQNWFWWKSNYENLALASKQKYSKLEDSPVFERNKVWALPLLEETKRQVDLSKEDEVQSISLSGGQLQKLILLRELLLEPSLLLLDEAFSALDPSTLGQVLEILEKEQNESGFKIISISHQKKILDLLPGKLYFFNLEENNKGQKILKITNPNKII